MLPIPSDYLRPLLLQRDKCRRHRIEISNCLDAPPKVRGRRAKVLALTLDARLRSYDQAIDFPQEFDVIGLGVSGHLLSASFHGSSPSATMNVVGRAWLSGRNSASLAPKSNPRCQGLTVSSQGKEIAMATIKVPSYRCVPLYVSAPMKQKRR